MKRGLIAWNPDELPRFRLQERLSRYRELAGSAGVPALVVYTDVWRSNQVRFLSNYMPYFNRALLVLPTVGKPVLLCGLSPRVYPWIRSVTILEEIRPGKNLGARLLELASEKEWERIGVVDYPMLPYEIYLELERAEIECIDVHSEALLRKADDAELAMRRTAVSLTRQLVEQSVGHGGEEEDFHLVSRVEKTLRHAGMEDVIIWVSAAGGAPRPPCGVLLAKGSSIVVAAEYRGHWVEVARPVSNEVPLSDQRKAFEGLLKDFSRTRTPVQLHDLSGPHPFRASDPARSLPAGSLIGVHHRADNGLLYGDTCLATGPGSATLL